MIDLENFQFSDKFFRWGLTVAMAMVVLAFMLAAFTPATSAPPCVDMAARALITQLSIP